MKTFAGLVMGVALTTLGLAGSQAFAEGGGSSAAAPSLAVSASPTGLAPGIGAPSPGQGVSSGQLGLPAGQAPAPAQQSLTGQQGTQGQQGFQIQQWAPPGQQSGAQAQQLAPEMPQAQQQGNQQNQQGEQQRQESAKDKGLLSGESLELSSVEKMMTSEDRMEGEKTRTISPVVKPVSQYGYSFFRGGTGQFSPLIDVPVGPDYVIGSGDRIVLSVWGSLEGTFELDVNKNGEVVLPKVGSVRVQGITYGNLPKVLRSHIAQVYKDFQLSVTLGRTRLIKVYIVGEVIAPGDYNISSLSTVINALSAAGGPTKNGTLRNIQIKRAGVVAETVDLYDFFLTGDKSKDVRLQPGDTLFIPAIGPVVGIAGNVRRPGIFELKAEKSLKDLLVLANGINPTGYLQRIQLKRVLAHEKSEVSDYSLDPKLTGKSLDDLTSHIAIQDLDYIKIFPIDSTLRGYVRLNGFVLRPGDYALHPGMKVDELLSKDNLLPEYADNTAELIRLYPPDFHPEISYFSPAMALSGDSAQNFLLKEFDQIRVFSRWDLEEMPRVRITGEVQRPGDYRLLKHMTVRELLIQAGNPKLTAYLAKAEIIRVKRDASSVTSYPIAINLEEALKGNPQDNIELQPLDELMVRRIPNWLDETDRYVTLKGEVKFPGTYPIFKGERLSDLIKRAGDFTDKAYLFGAKFTRTSVAKLQQERMNDVIARMEKDIAMKEQDLGASATSKEEIAATRVTLDGLKKSIDRLKTTPAEGRVAMTLTPLDQFTGSPFDLELSGGDTLLIPQSTGAVTVLGEVASPTTVIHLPGRDVTYYLRMAGGPTNNAEPDEMYVVMANGMVRGRSSDGMFGSFMSAKLHPGDTIIVPQALDRISWMKEIKDITQILANIAVAAGVPLAVIK